MKQPLYNNKGLENQLKNLGFQAHDLICGCDKPAKHLEYLFNTKKCDPTTATKDPATTNTDAVDIIDSGDLEKLFEQDVFEDDKR